MIHSLYHLTGKGWLKALSFLLATLLFAMILMNSITFAERFGGGVPYLAILAFYGMAILWIHGIGFEIRQMMWQLTFLPIMGYVIVVGSLIYLIY